MTRNTVTRYAAASAFAGAPAPANVAPAPANVAPAAVGTARAILPIVGNDGQLERQPEQQGQEVGAQGRTEQPVTGSLTVGKTTPLTPNAKAEGVSALHSASVTVTPAAPAVGATLAAAVGTVRAISPNIMTNTVALALGSAGFVFVAGVEYAKFGRNGVRNYTVTQRDDGRFHVVDHIGPRDEYFDITVFELVGQWLS